MNIFIIFVFTLHFFIKSADRNSESESVTNEDSSDNNIGPITNHHNNTTTAHDTLNNSSSLSSSNKNSGKNQTTIHDSLGMNSKEETCFICFWYTIEFYF